LEPGFGLIKAAFGEKELGKGKLLVQKKGGDLGGPLGKRELGLPLILARN